MRSSVKLADTRVFCQQQCTGGRESTETRWGRARVLSRGEMNPRVFGKWLFDKNSGFVLFFTLQINVQCQSIPTSVRRCSPKKKHQRRTGRRKQPKMRGGGGRWVRAPGEDLPNGGGVDAVLDEEAEERLVEEMEGVPGREADGLRGGELGGRRHGLRARLRRGQGFLGVRGGGWRKRKGRRGPTPFQRRNKYLLIFFTAKNIPGHGARPYERRARLRRREDGDTTQAVDRGDGRCGWGQRRWWAIPWVGSA